MKSATNRMMAQMPALGRVVFILVFTTKTSVQSKVKLKFPRGATAMAGTGIVCVDSLDRGSRPLKATQTTQTTANSKQKSKEY